MARQLGALSVYLNADTSNFTSKMRGATKDIKGFGMATGGMNDIVGMAMMSLKRYGGMIAAAAGATGIGSIVKSSLDAYGKQEQREAKLAQVLKVTGNTARITRKELSDYASELQSLTLTGDEDIMKIQTRLLAVGGMSKSVFKQANALILDMAETSEISADGITTIVGKALSNPLKGLSALSRSGIAVSNEMRDKVKQLTEAGKKEEAQLLILTNLQQRYGGVAAAAANTDLGRKKQMANAYDDIFEGIGKTISMTLDLKGTYKSLADTFGSWAASIAKNAPIIAFSIKSVFIDVKYAIKELWTYIQPFVSYIWNFIGDVFGELGDLIAWGWTNIQTFLKGILTNLGGFWEDVKLSASNFWDWLIKSALAAGESINNALGLNKLMYGQNQYTYQNQSAEAGNKFMADFGRYSMQPFETTPMPTRDLNAVADKFALDFNNITKNLNQLDKDKNSEYQKLLTDTQKYFDDINQKNNDRGKKETSKQVKSVVEAWEKGAKTIFGSFDAKNLFRQFPGFDWQEKTAKNTEKTNEILSDIRDNGGAVYAD